MYIIYLGERARRRWAATGAGRQRPEVIGAVVVLAGTRLLGCGLVAGRALWCKRAPTHPLSTPAAKELVRVLCEGVCVC